MIFEAAEGTTAAGHAYVRDYVRGKLASGATPSEVLEQFSCSAEDDIDEESLVRTVLASVQRRQDFDLGRELVARNLQRLHLGADLVRFGSAQHTVLAGFEDLGLNPQKSFFIRTR